MLLMSNFNVCFINYIYSCIIIVRNIYLLISYFIQNLNRKGFLIRVYITFKIFNFLKICISNTDYDFIIIFFNTIIF